MCPKKLSHYTYHDKDLYVSAVSQILVLKDIEQHLDNPPAPAVFYPGFPKDVWHGWKFIKFGPDNRLYVPVGAPCNICIPPSRIFATITRLLPNGGTPEIVASGIRNTVGFDWSPVTGELWFTNNGRDNMGDNLPPDELNKVSGNNPNYGFPYIHGNGVYDPKYGIKIPAGLVYTPPEMELEAHVAPLGMRFYTGDMFPTSYKNQIFIAEHGSWNRSKKTGYRIVLVRLDKSGKHAVSKEIFADGWLQGQKTWGRPADVEVGPDGALYVSDDHAGVIYRISYGE